MTPNQSLKILAILTSLSLLAACGNKKQDEGTTDLGSRTTPTEVSGQGQKAWAYCNTGKGSTFSVRNKVATENNNIRNDLLWLKFSSLAESFKDNKTYIQMFRWKANSQEQTYLDPTPLSFKFVRNNAAITNDMTHLNFAQIAQAYNSLQASSIKAFMDATTILVNIRDPYAEFDVIKVVVYNESHQAIDQMDMLIPIFAAKPSDYAVESTGAARAQTLKNLHPFQSSASQSWTAAHYQTLADGFCF
ncbi:MAG: hypothetical protein ACLGGX_08095 [Bdellovibrionia bacterium]